MNYSDFCGDMQKIFAILAGCDMKCGTYACPDYSGKTEAYMAVKKTPAKKSVSAKKTTTKKTVKKTKPAVKKAAKKTVSAKKVPAVSANKAAAVKKPAMSADKNSISVIEMPGNSFVIVLGTARLFFAIDEMRKLVRICHEAPSEEQASVRLFSWFSMNRSDVLKDAGIKKMSDPALMLVYRYLISHYSLKQD